MKNNIITTAPQTASAATYAAILGLTPENRAQFLRDSTVTTGDVKKTVAKTLAAMIAANDCPAGKIREKAKEITGKDIRENFQSIYELLAVFQAVIAGKIAITEEEFEAMESSKLALLSPFLSKEELLPLLDQAVELAKTGTAAQIRELKPEKEKKEPKAVKEMRERAEHAEAEAARAEKRADDMAEAYKVEIPFYCTDIEKGAPILTSTQVRNRIKADINGAATRKDAESLAYHADMLSKAFFGTCQLAGLDALEMIAALASQFAKPSEKSANPSAAVEVEAIAA